MTPNHKEFSYKKYRKLIFTNKIHLFDYVQTDKKKMQLPRVLLSHIFKLVPLFQVECLQA